MKVYFLILNIFGMGGTVKTVLNIANYLAENDYDIEIISLFRRQKRPFFYIHPKIKVTVLHDLYGRNKERKGIKKKVANMLESTKSFIIHKDEESIQQFSLLTDLKLIFYIRSIKEGVLISTRPCFNLLISKFGNKNVTLVGQEHINFEAHPTALKKSIKRYYSKLDYLITLTEKDTEHYKKIFRNGKPKILKISNSIEQISLGKSKLDEKVVIAAGRLDPVKRYDLLIKAFSIVAKKHPDWKLKIFGSGKERENLVKLIQEEHLYNHVYLMGPTHQLKEELKKSSIFAVTSQVEGFGLVIAEAMQSGVPVVSFDCPHGPSEIIKHGEDGILVTNDDYYRLAESINYLIENEAKRIEMGRLAIKNITRFSIHSIGNRWEWFLNSIHYVKTGERRNYERATRTDSHKLGV